MSNHITPKQSMLFYDPRVKPLVEALGLVPMASPEYIRNVKIQEKVDAWIREFKSQEISVTLDR